MRATADSPYDARTRRRDVAKHVFLSPAWLAEVKKLHAAHAGKSKTKATAPMQVNYVVTGAPFHKGDLLVHADTTSGQVVIGEGHLPGAAAKMTLPYTRAKALLFDGNPQAAMQAYAAGELVVEGSLEAAVQADDAEPDAAALALSAAIAKVTK
jgi:hypothetical protein